MSCFHSTFFIGVDVGLALAVHELFGKAEFEGLETLVSPPLLANLKVKLLATRHHNSLAARQLAITCEGDHTIHTFIP